MKIKKADSAIQEGDMTPMIDMTFQLVAFLMVLVNFNAEDVSARIKLPSSKLAKAPDKPAEHPVIIQLDDKSKVIMGGGEDLAVPAIRGILKREAVSLSYQNKSPKDATVIIRAHMNAKAGEVQDIVKICQEEKFENFVLRAQEQAR
jgi:biopolymer transport protein ExbD